MARLLVTTLACCLTLSLVTSAPTADDGKTWALLIATSEAQWGKRPLGNYRHQANVLHAYHVLTGRGMAAENIVTMMVDDVANNPYNPYPGQVFNTPKKEDVYKGVPIDYSGASITPENFLAVLSGNKAAVKGGNGRVIESTSKDNIFVYLADHGGDGKIIFPRSQLTAKDLRDTVHKMHSEGRYKQLTLYLETCESGSMFDDSYKDIGIYALTASNASVASWSAYCNVDETLIGLCLGDVFSIYWMADSEQAPSDETLDQQFRVVHDESWSKVIEENPGGCNGWADQSWESPCEMPVSQYGDLSIAKQPISDFQGQGNASSHRSREKLHLDIGELHPVHDITVSMLKAEIRRSLDGGHFDRAHYIHLKLSEIKAKRAYYDAFIQRLAYGISGDAATTHRLISSKLEGTYDLICHHRVVTSFGERCFTFSENPYVLSRSYVLGNFCKLGFSADYVVAEFERTCPEITVRKIA